MKIKMKKISRLCLVFLLSICLVFPNASFLTDAYADSTSNIESARLQISGEESELTLSSLEKNAVTAVISDCDTPMVNVYPSDEGKKNTNYACKLYYYDYDATKNAWKTETMWSNQKLNGGGLTKYAQFNFIGTRAKHIATGELHKFKVEVNTKITNGENVETYYFNIIRSVGLSKVTATNSEGQSLATMSTGANQYTIACPYNTLNLTCTAKTPSLARIKVDGVEVTSGSAYSVDLAKYTENDNVGKTIPVTVEYTGTEGTGQGTSYTIIVKDTDYTPQVTTSYTGGKVVDETAYGDITKKLTCNKDASVTMSAAATAPEGSNLTYQWYSNDVQEGTDKAIEGETNPTYTIPTNYSRQIAYHCVVTNTVEGTTFTAESEHCLVVVNPTYASAPYIAQQPSSTDFICGQPEAKISIDARSYDLGAELKYQWYVSTENSTENGTEIQGANQSSVSVDTSEVGTKYYYCKIKSSLKDDSGKVNESQEIVSGLIKVVIKSTTEYFSEGEGTKDKPLIIKTEADFETIRTLVAAGNSLAGTYFKIVAENNEITLPQNWQMIGTLKSGYTSTELGIGVLPFSGNIDGNGCTIKIPENGKPLFRYVRDASISNLKIYGENINGAGLIDEYFVDYGSDGDYSSGVPDAVTIDNVTLLSGSKTQKSGFIHGVASGKNNILITNSVIESGVTIGYDKTEGSIGSFAGNLNGEIINCKSAADVYGTTAVGGIAGVKGQSMGTCSVLNCEFTGTVTASGNYAGGMIGSGYDGLGSAPNTPVVSIQNCIVSGKITGRSHIGGILGGEPGCENCWANGAGSVCDNVFCGTIQATGTDAVVGAIVGFMKSYNTNQSVDSNYFTENCGAENGVGKVEIIHDSDFDITKSGSAVSADDMKNGTVVSKLNSSSSSFKNWTQGAEYPTHTAEAVLYAIELSGQYKTEYKTGDAFSTDGMVITGKLSDGSTKNISLSDKNLKFTGFNSNQRSVQTITVAYGSIKTSYEIRVLYNESKTKEIVAYFTLLGDSSHDEATASGGPHTLASGNLTTWVPRTKVTITNNTSVYDVFQKVLKDKGIEWEGSDDNQYSTMYISGVKIPGSSEYLSEFSNGNKSGWMYTLNGSHPTLGVAQQFLSNGDEIVFHYTDDYTVEEGSDKWTTDTTTETVDKVTTSGTTGSATTTTPTETKVTEKTAADGTKEKTATVTVTADNQTEIIKQATEKKSEEIVLEAAAADTKSAQTIQVELDKTFVKNVSEKTDADLTVNTENGKVTLDQETIKTVLSEAKGSTITIEVSKVEKPTEVQKEAAGTNGEVVDLTVKSGNTVIHDFGSGKVTVKLEIPTALKGKNVAAIYIADDGKTEQMPGKTLTENSKKYYEFTTSHFSTFALVDADELGLDVADELDVKAEVAKLTPVARSSKTAKKNIKVTTSLDKSDKAIIAELKDAGYTVKYRFYRSTKKASSYKAKLTGTTGKYTNTAGKKGTRYYYKVQLRVYDQTGKLVAKTALKQCKYATRIFG